MTLLTKSNLPPRDHIADLVVQVEGVVHVCVDGVVGVEGEAALVDRSTVDVIIERTYELADGGGAVEPDHLVRIVEEMDGKGVWE